MIEKHTSISDAVDQLTAPGFDPVQTVNEAVPGNQSVQDQHVAAITLMSTLDQQSQNLNGELEQALSTLQKSEKRLPHEIDLLKNDINAFHTQQQETLLPVMDLARQTRQSPVFTELAELQEIKRRMQSVRDLLLEAQAGKPPASEERAQQLAAVFAHTPDESKWKTGNASYYQFINKIIK